MQIQWRETSHAEILKYVLEIYESIVHIFSG